MRHFDLDFYRECLRRIPAFRTMFGYNDALYYEGAGYNLPNAPIIASMESGMSVESSLNVLRTTCTRWHLDQNLRPNTDMLQERISVLWAASLVSREYFGDVHHVGTKSFIKFLGGHDFEEVAYGLAHSGEKIEMMQLLSARARAAAEAYFDYWINDIGTNSWNGYLNSTQVVQKGIFCETPNITAGRAHIVMTRGFGVDAPLPLRKFVMRCMKSAPEDGLLITTNDWGFGCKEMASLRANDERGFARGIELQREIKLILLKGFNNKGEEFMIATIMNGDEQLAGSDKKIHVEPLEELISQRFGAAIKIDPNLSKEVAARIYREQGRLSHVAVIDGFDDPEIEHGFSGAFILIDENVVNRNAGRKITTNADWQSRTAHFEADEFVDHVYKIARGVEDVHVAVGRFSVPMRGESQELAGYEVGSKIIRD